MRHLLVVGPGSNAGKTTMSKALVLALREGGTPAGGLKLLGVNHLHADFDAVAEMLARGRLCGSDPSTHAAAAGLGFPCEVHGPHTLLVDGVRVLAARVTVCEGDAVEHVFYLDRAAFAARGVEGLLEALAGATVVDLDLAGRERWRERVALAVRSAVRTVSARCDALVFESPGVLGLPWNGIDHLDDVVFIEHGQTRIYDGAAYLREWRRLDPEPDHQFAKLARIADVKPVSTPRVLASLEPRRAVPIPPLRRSDLDAGFLTAARTLLA
jgi:hypothetical protein